jgi:pyridoxamine 5'-phosphate oxidase family protein
LIKAEEHMNRFTEKEVAYLQSQRLARMATVSENGDLHVVPVGFRYNPEYDTIDIGGHNFASSKKYRDAVRHGRIAIVVDDVQPPWKPRFVEVRGRIEAVSSGGKSINEHFEPDMLRLTPTYIVSFGVNDAGIMPDERQKVNYHGRKVEA